MSKAYTYQKIAERLLESFGLEPSYINRRRVEEFFLQVRELHDYRKKSGVGK